MKSSTNLRKNSLFRSFPNNTLKAGNTDLGIPKIPRCISGKIPAKGAINNEKNSFSNPRLHSCALPLSADRLRWLGRKSDVNAVRFLLKRCVNGRNNRKHLGKHSGREQLKQRSKHLWRSFNLRRQYAVKEKSQKVGRTSAFKKAGVRSSFFSIRFWKNAKHISKRPENAPTATPSGKMSAKIVGDY